MSLVLALQILSSILVLFSPGQSPVTVREKVLDMRRRFTNLLEENAALPSNEQLPRDAFYVDPGLQEATLRETAARLEEAKAEMAFDSEKILLARSKLEQAFLKGLTFQEVEKICAESDELKEL